MRSLVLVVFVMTLMSAPLRGGEDLAEGFSVVTHTSAALGREASYIAYVPVDARESEVFPVLFILHGAWGNHRDWYNNTRLRDLARVHRMILILPDGGEFGWYLDSPLVEESQYESYIMGDLMADVAARFPVHPTARGVMGLSMGGHGAMILSARHAGTFQSASSLSGILKLTNHGEKWEIERRLGPIAEHPERWEDHSVWDQAKVFQDAGMRLLFDCGVEDTDTGAIFDNRMLHGRLKELEVPHIWRENAGNHTWEYWGDHLNEHLVFHQAAMIDDTPGFTRWQRHWYERVRLFHDENAQFTITPPERPVLVLLGPSTMEALTADLFPGFTVVNRGIVADGVGVAPRGTAQRLEASVFDIKPDAVIYSDATNDIGDLSRHGEPSLEEIAERYEQNIAEMRHRLPDLRIVLPTCGPARGRYALINDNIARFNRGVQGVAFRQGTVFVKTHGLLVDEVGQLREEFTSDGLHLNEAGTKVYVEALNRALHATTESSREME